jgi:hypothetical protein
MVYPTLSALVYFTLHWLYFRFYPDISNLNRIYSSAAFLNFFVTTDFFQLCLALIVKDSLPYSNTDGVIALQILNYTVSQEVSSVLWEVIVSVILRKNVYMNMCPIPNDFRYLARNIFLPSHRNAPISEARESVWSVSWLLWLLIERDGRKILRAKFKILRPKYRKPFGIGHMFIWKLFPGIMTFPPGTLYIADM